MGIRCVCSYFNAKTFKDVHIVTRRSMQKAVFDGMVRLWCSEQLDAMCPKHQIFGLQDIIYSTREELTSLLDEMEDSTQPEPSGVSASSVDLDGFLPGDEVGEHDDDDQQELDKVEEAGQESYDLLPDTEIPEGLYAGHSEQDEQAAIVIQHVWSKYLDRKRDMMKAGHESSARRWFVVYRKALLPDMRPRSSPRYCVYFLGPVPNLQAALDRKSTRLNSSHLGISYAVFCLKKK